VASRSASDPDPSSMTTMPAVACGTKTVNVSAERPQKALDSRFVTD
jgi:hypothetical protein